jgi:hypothetical protein
VYIFKYYPEILQEVLKKIAKKYIQDTPVSAEIQIADVQKKNQGR